MAAERSTTEAKFDEYAENYTNLHAESVAASGESVTYFADYKVARLLRLAAPTDAPLLDFGCGIGNVTERIARSFADVHGFEPSTKSCDVARTRIPTATFYETTDAIPDDHFATAVLSGVLHHVPPEERPEIVGTILRKLRPGGRLFVFEHNPLNPLTRRAVAMCPFDDDAILLWPRPARRLLRDHGFQDVRTHHIVFFPRALAAFRGLEPSLRWLPVGAQFLLVGTRPDGTT